MANFGASKTWTDQEVLTHTDLNAAFSNIINNVTSNGINADNIDETDDYTWSGENIFTGTTAVTVLTNAAANVQTAVTYSWDPADGNQMTDNSSGIGIDFKMPDASDNQDVYASLVAMCIDDTAGSEDGEFSFKVMTAGTNTEQMTLSTNALTVTPPNLNLSSDSAVLSLGAGADFTITHDGTTGATLAGNPIVIDSGDDLTLDAHTGIFSFKDAGSEILRITEGNSGDVTIKLVTNAKDLKFSDNGDAVGLTILDAAAGVNVAGALNIGSVAAAGSDTDKFLVLDGSGNVDYRTGAQVLSDIGAASSGSSAAVTALNNATANELVTVGSTTTELDAEGNLTYSSDALATTSSSANLPTFEIKNTHADATAGKLIFTKDPASGQGADNDVMGTIEFFGTDAGNNAVEKLAYIDSYVVEADHGSEAAGLRFFVAENDATVTQGLSIVGQASDDGEVDVTIGAGAASTTTIAGTLTMGSTAALTNAGLVSVANQSNITGVGTITSGTWGATDIAIAHGGTGASSASDARSNLGLGTMAVADTSDYSAVAGSSSTVTTGALNSGSITSGFGSINIGSSTITTTGALAAGATTVTGTLAVGNGATSAGKIELYEDTDDGAHKLTLTTPSLASDVTLTFPNTDGDVDQVLTTDGSGALSWSDAGGGAYSDWVILTDSATVATKAQVICNKATAMTVTLPSSPSAGNSVTIKNVGATVTVARNGKDIDSVASDGTLLTNSAVQLVFVNDTFGWVSL